MAKVYPIFPSKLEARTRELLNKSKLAGKKISEDTGLSQGWISQFSTGLYKHYSVGRIERLYEYLTKKELSF